jgi:hypothetical protein
MALEQRGYERRARYPWLLTADATEEVVGWVFVIVMGIIIGLLG